MKNLLFSCDEIITYGKYVQFGVEVDVYGVAGSFDYRKAVEIE